MLNNILSDFYERDIRKLMEEVNLFRDDQNLWKTQGAVKNSCGNLVLHIAGGLNYFIGEGLAQTGYVRNRELEFSKKEVDKQELISQLEELIPLISKTVSSLTPEQMEKEFPIFFDKPGTSVSYVLVQLLLHLNYHLGQVNYLRRGIES